MNMKLLKILKTSLKPKPITEEIKYDDNETNKKTLTSIIHSISTNQKWRKEKYYEDKLYISFELGDDVKVVEALISKAKGNSFSSFLHVYESLMNLLQTLITLVNVLSG